MMPQTLYHHLGPDAERIWRWHLTKLQEHAEQAARDAEAMRNMAEANDE